MTEIILRIAFIALLFFVAVFAICGIPGKQRFFPRTPPPLKTPMLGKKETRDAEDLKMFFESIKPYIDEMGCYGARTWIYEMQGGYCKEIAGGLIKDAMKKGVEYKQLYESLKTEKEIELRKFCVERAIEAHISSFDHTAYADYLYRYLVTGKTNNKKEEEKS